MVYSHSTNNQETLLFSGQVTLWLSRFSCGLSVPVLDKSLRATRSRSTKDVGGINRSDALAVVRATSPRSSSPIRRSGAGDQGEDPGYGTPGSGRSSRRTWQSCSATSRVGKCKIISRDAKTVLPAGPWAIYRERALGRRCGSHLVATALDKLRQGTAPRRTETLKLLTISRQAQARDIRCQTPRGEPVEVTYRLVIRNAG